MDLQDKMLIAINAANYEDYKEMANACANISGSHTIQFSKWKDENYKKLPNGLYGDFRNLTKMQNFLTIEQLYSLFLNSKDNGK